MKREVSGALDLSAANMRLQLSIERLYAEYSHCLNSGRFEEWPDFFTDDAVYKIISRENHESQLPLAAWLCEGRGYLQDRVNAISKTLMYGPRYLHRSVSGVMIESIDSKSIGVRAGYLAVETLQDEISRVFSCGTYLDKVTEADGELKFLEKICVFDSTIVLNSMIFPL